MCPFLTKHDLNIDVVLCIWIYISLCGMFLHLRFKDYAHCCIALKILGGMKVIICFWVTSQLCLFLRPHRHSWNQKWGLSSYPCLPVKMLKNLPNDSTTLLRLSNCTKAKQPNCNVKSQSVFLSHIWRNAATCLPIPSPSLTIPHWLFVFLCTEIWFTLHVTAIMSSCYSMSLCSCCS